MSKNSFVKLLLTLMVMTVLLAAACRKAPAQHALPNDRAELLGTAVAVPGGAYRVGSREPGCYSLEEVTLSPFSIWPMEVPAAWWQAYRGEAASVDDRLPATEVSLTEAQAFCVWFSERYGVTARLPTRHEWEVAARAGTAGVPYPWDGIHQRAGHPGRQPTARPFLPFMHRIPGACMLWPVTSRSGWLEKTPRPAWQR